MDPKEEERARVGERESRLLHSDTAWHYLMFLICSSRLALGPDVWQAGCKALQLEQHKSLCSEAAVAVHLCSLLRCDGTQTSQDMHISWLSVPFGRRCARWRVKEKSMVHDFEPISKDLHSTGPLSVRKGVSDL